ncbi:hypothetical protein M885DRAFT_528576 [Pelagophyceae sp. CCMP2097]|nr:hypothetical protein M885DRAFT_528576 [Pelagophyceae sp. CCMP2097]
MQDGSRLSPIDAFKGPAIGMTYLSPDIRMTMGDVAPIICDDPADDDGPLSGISVSLFAEEALDSLRDDARSQTLNTFSLDKIFEEMMPVMQLQRLPTPPPCDPAVSAPRAEMPKRGRAAEAAPSPRGPAAAAHIALNKMVRFQRQLFGRELRQRQRHHAAQGARRAAAREQGNGRRGRRVERLRRPRRARRMRRPVLNSKVIFTRMSKRRFL